MNIALLGYGKMGKTIESLALNRGHTIGLKLSATNAQDLSIEALNDIDVAIEFSTPSSAIHNLSICAASKTNTVCGTTGWLEEKDKIDLAFANVDAAFLYASNFSIGVNIFFEINRKLSQLMNAHPEYKATLEEIHHIHKKDSPSGTGITIANDIISNHQDYNEWKETNAPAPKVLPIHAIREGEVFGTHSVEYQSEIDCISIRHEAKSRQGFAMGALLAAEWIYGKSGIFSMKDVLGID